MKQFLSIIILGLLLVSCSEDDSPSLNTNRVSKVIGGKIYTWLQGNNQTGAPGQFLNEDIKILITDLQGNPIRTRLEYVLSDESGLIYHQQAYTDTIVFKWMMGCEETLQSLTVRDLNVCGVAKDECIEVDVFFVEATATEDVSSGWYMPCTNIWPYTGTGYFINDNHISYLSGNKIITIQDPLDPEAKIILLPENSYYQMLEMISSGEIFSNYYQYKFLYSPDPELDYWRAVNSPYYSYGTVELDVTESGDYFIVAQINSKIFKSNDGTSWTEYMDLNQTTNSNVYGAQLMAVDKNSLYIATNNTHVTEINTITNKTKLHHFQQGIWSSNQILGSYHAEVVDNFMFIKSKHSSSSGSILVVLDLMNNRKQTFDLGHYKMFKSAGKLYLIRNFNDIKVWENNNFMPKEYAISFSYSGSSIVYGIFRGSPIGLISSGNNQTSSIIYYIE